MTIIFLLLIMVLSGWVFNLVDSGNFKLETLSSDPAYVRDDARSAARIKKAKFIGAIIPFSLFVLLAGINLLYFA